jgi:septal ring factor EnvC (AmiA/AmiB activator)
VNRICKLFLLFIVIVGGSAAADNKDIRTQQNDLGQIQKEYDASRKRLDSLKQAESGIQKQINNFDQKISSSKKVIARLNRELNQLKESISTTENQLADHQLQLDYAKRRYLGNIRQFYMATLNRTEFGLPEPNDELKIDRKITYLAAVANFESGHVAQAGDLLADALTKRDELSGEQKKISNLRNSKETSTALEKTRKQKQEKDLEKIRRRKAEEADRLLTLEQAAREIEAIIARLEAEQRHNRDGAIGPSIMAPLKGQLPAPVRGRVTETFGNHVDPITNLKSFSPGITIKAAAGAVVVSVASGEIVHVGQLRGYGKFVIINHDDHYYTTYAGLGSITVGQGQFIGSRSKLGTAGTDGLVKFEIRRGREPEDPVKWISLDSF